MYTMCCSWACYDRDTGVTAGDATHMFVVFLVVICILFGMFTCCMLSEQYARYNSVMIIWCMFVADVYCIVLHCSIETDETTVERIIRTKKSDSAGGGAESNDEGDSSRLSNVDNNSFEDEDGVDEFDEICGSVPIVPGPPTRSRCLYSALCYLIPTPARYKSKGIRDRVFGYSQCGAGLGLAARNVSASGGGLCSYLRPKRPESDSTYGGVSLTTTSTSTSTDISVSTSDNVHAEEQGLDATEETPFIEPIGNPSLGFNMDGGNSINDNLTDVKLVGSMEVVEGVLMDAHIYASCTTHIA